MSKQTYHHGDLQAALLDEALSLIERTSLEGLSLREIARKAGVSATAVYRHFPAKSDLLKALAHHGLEMLASQQRKAAGRAPAAEAFAHSGRAYVRFALKHPNLFRLIFIHTPGYMRPESESPEGSPAWLLRHHVELSLGPKATPEKVFVSVLRAWSLVHGLSMLILDGQVERKEAEAVIDRVIA